MQRKFSFILLCFVWLPVKIYSQTPEEDIFRLENSYEVFAKKMDSAFVAFVENRESEYKKWIEEEKEWIRLTLSDPEDDKQKIPKQKSKKKQKTKKTKPVPKPPKKKKTEHTKKEEKKIKKIHFVKPIKIEYRFSADFGYRIHPIFKVKKFHYGIDMGCPTGTNIHAVMGGTVIVSRLSKGYGNFVIIQHTKNLRTIYAHMSKRLVKRGDVVKQNDIIGLVGSTGRSTGPHLHFEVVENNKKIHPKKYIKL